MLRILPLVLAGLLVSPAVSAIPFTLTLDPSQSSLTVGDLFTGDPLFGPVPLSGTLTIDVSALPSGSFTLTQLDATGAGGVLLANGSGSGVHGSGALLFTTPLLLDVTVPGFVPSATNLGFPAPLGTLTPNGSDTAIASAGFLADFQLSGTETLELQVFALPEPAGLWLLAAAGLAGLRRRR